MAAAGVRLADSWPDFLGRGTTVARLPAEAGGIGELVIQCPDAQSAYDLGMSWNADGGIAGNLARVEGDLVIAQGPVNTL